MKSTTPAAIKPIAPLFWGMVWVRPTMTLKPGVYYTREATAKKAEVCRRILPMPTLYPEITAAEFPEQTLVIARNQPQYAPLPAYLKRDESGTKIFCWKLSWAARLGLLITGRLWHQVLTFNTPLQPVMLSVKKPDMPPQA